ncbi:MFS transporter [Gordonia rhizosphera]|uniref:Putative drug resistance transporter n=1 Tax=Gordonia rhizosphera NBRC 16068 TaxID=1108045 RepID=K6WN86_9ACTN|nr:MFS transporter [Gordonia rhizosphera]GAB93607.1 putative drug resistance transporter [Gordonia rhizosphera NBRC 16068]
MSTLTPASDRRHGEVSGADRRMWWGLAVLTLPVLLVSMDFSVLYLAIPAITDSLAPSATEQLWILDIYGFGIAGLLITMGNVGDRVGRRRILLAGAALFGAASVLAAFAPSAAVLIAARALMGVGGATLMPSSLSLIANMFPNARDRARAIGVWTAAFAGGSALGPVIGGILLHHYWWGVVFLINVPVLAVLFLTAPRLVPEYRAASSEPFDFVGVGLSMLGILPLVYAVKTMAAEGVDATVLAIGLFGVLMLALFLAQQRRAPAPLLDLKLFGNPMFSGAVAVALVGMMALGGMSYLTGVYLQSVRGFDVLTAALAGLPMAVAVAVFSIGASRVVAVVGLRTAFVGSILLAAAGNLGLLALSMSSPMWVYLVFTSVAGIGYGVQFSLVSDVVVGSVPVERSGAASGISETSFELGTALGLALLGSLATLVFREHSQGWGFGDTLGETLHVAHGNEDAGSAVAAAARSAFVDGMHTASLASVIALGVLAVVLSFAMRTRRAVMPR